MDASYVRLRRYRNCQWHLLVARTVTRIIAVVRVPQWAPPSVGLGVQSGGHLHCRLPSRTTLIAGWCQSNALTWPTRSVPPARGRKLAALLKAKEAHGPPKKLAACQCRPPRSDRAYGWTSRLSLRHRPMAREARVALCPLMGHLSAMQQRCGTRTGSDGRQQRPSEDPRDKDGRDCLRVLRPVVAVLVFTADVVAPRTMAEQDEKVNAAPTNDCADRPAHTKGACML